MAEGASCGDSIALYGSLMRGLGGMNAMAVEDRLRFIAPCQIGGLLFDLGDYPGLREGDGAVVGELFELLDSDVLPILDRFEDFYPDAPSESLYLRKRVQLISPTSTNAWIYVYNRAPDSQQRVAHGDWRRYLAERDPR